MCDSYCESCFLITRALAENIRYLYSFVLVYDNLLCVQSTALLVASYLIGLIFMCAAAYVLFLHRRYIRISLPEICLLPQDFGCSHEYYLSSKHLSGSLIVLSVLCRAYRNTRRRSRALSSTLFIFLELYGFHMVALEFFSLSRMAQLSWIWLHDCI